MAVLWDEIYSQMLYDGRKHVSLLKYPQIRDRLIVLDGWSKTYAMTGWRLGFSVWPQIVGRDRHAPVRQQPFVRQCADPVRRHRRTRGPAGRCRQRWSAPSTSAAAPSCRCSTSFPASRCVNPGGAFYAFPNVTGTGLSAKELQNRMLEKAGVATVAGTSFGIHGEGYIRFSYANSIENIKRAIERIGALLMEK